MLTMGNYGLLLDSTLPATSTESNTADEPLAMATDMADKYVAKGTQTLQKLAQITQLSEYTKTIGLGDINKQLTADRIKTILAAYALVKITSGLRTKMGRYILLGLASVAVIAMRDQIFSMFSKDAYIEQRSGIVVPDDVKAQVDAQAVSEVASV